MIALKKGVNQFSTVLYKAIEIISVLMLLAMVIIVSLEVFLRYVNNQGFAWILEVGTLLLQYLAFSCMVLGVKYKLHISLLIIYNRLPNTAQKILTAFINMCILFFGVMICFYGYGVTSQMWRFSLPATGWTQGLTYLICVFAGAVVAYEGLVSLLGLNDDSVIWKNAEPVKHDEDESTNKEGGEAVV